MRSNQKQTRQKAEAHKTTIAEERRARSGASSGSAWTAGATQRDDEPVDARSHFAVKVMLELFENQPKNLRGQSYYKLGAPGYRLYLNRASEVSELSRDPQLPQIEDLEVKYEGEGEWGRWNPLNDTRRIPNTVLTSFTVTCWSRANWKFTQNPYANETWYYHMNNRNHLKSLSYCLNSVLRHSL